ncbi:sensor histidine kinase [Halothiobacillus sp. DCM-1]|uniref:sensor histidine kinase n=1 Tax=Halothiobacillus sp. DCM-1 TaxID=3112558 RepID=UPI00324587F7
MTPNRAAVRPPGSLVRRVSRSIVAVSALAVLLVGGVAGRWAFLEAQALQDDNLQEIASLMQNGHLLPRPAMSVAAQAQAAEVDDDLITVEPLCQTPQQTACLRGIPPSMPDGLHTLSLADRPGSSQWRVLLFTQPASGQRVAVAQPVDLRSDLAWHNTLGVLVAMSVLTLLLVGVIPAVVRQSFRPLRRLSAALLPQGAKLPSAPPKPELVAAAPQEILPFIEAIDTLLGRMQASLTQQQRFIADAAHELRTPLAALIIQAENLAYGEANPAQQERLRGLEQGLLRLRQLVAQLLDLARLQADEGGAGTPVALHRLVEQVLVELHPLAESRRIDLGIVERTPVWVRDRDERLRQLIRNGLANALQYTPTGGTVDVRVITEPVSAGSVPGGGVAGARMAVVSIDDTGIGIPEAELGSVWQPFARGSNVTEPGTGLGLAISQTIAQSLGGEIRLHNRPEGGAHFEYRQPAVPAPEDAPNR